MKTYKLVSYNGKNVSVTKFENNEFVASIPFDPDNTDYQAYLKWLEDPANQPLPAENS